MNYNDQCYEPCNLVLILSDEHRADAMGCAGHAFVQTPNLDRLAASGTRFSEAICNSPICVPSRASLATGKYPHQIGSWDNAHPYDGSEPGWHHLVRDAGYNMVSIGKLHFRGRDDYGFTEELLPMHVLNGVGDLKGLLRRPLGRKAGTEDLAAEAGPGYSSYCKYDEDITERAKDWLRHRAADPTRFALFISFVMPHFPMIAPPETYDLYQGISLEKLSRGLTLPPSEHPQLERMRAHLNYDIYFTDESRARALRAYFGMITRLDQLVGEILSAIEETGLNKNTRVIYSSDHGDNLGNRGLWGKSVMYRDSLSVPMIMSGPQVPGGAICDTPVSLCDVAPTVTSCMGLSSNNISGFVGENLLNLANQPKRDRIQFAEYHAVGAETGQYMVRRGKWKYVHFVGADNQLFDIENDPNETQDLGKMYQFSEVVKSLHSELLKHCDPIEVNRRAFDDQARKISAHGGKYVIESYTDIPFTPPP